MSKDAPNPTLKELRERLNHVDDEMVRLLAQRLDTVGLIAKEKANSTRAIRDHERERQILGRVEGLAQVTGSFGPADAQNLLRDHQLLGQSAGWQPWLASTAR